MARVGDPSRSPWSRCASLGWWVLIAALLVLAAYHVLLTLSTASAYTLRYPFMDQFRCNFRYLTMPFPQSVLALENGHRPVLPGIVRVIELEWLGGMPVLQAATAWLAAGIAAAILVREVHRGLPGRPILQAAGFCVVGTLLLWNANARMFIHPFEAVHVFYILFFVVVAIELSLRATGETERLPWLASIGACVAATFTFGPGIASFAAPVSVALLRRRFRSAIVVVVGGLITLFAYYALMPGAAGVQAHVSASPASVFFALARLGAVFAELLRPSFPVLPLLAAVASLAGSLAFGAVATSVIGRWFRRDAFRNMEIVGVALFAFGFAANALIAVSRSDYFFVYPGEVFADRYLFWSCVAWVGLTLYALARVRDSSGTVRYATGIGIAALSISAIPSAVWANGWSAEVHRLSELSAVAAQLGIRDDVRLAAISDEGPASASRTLDELRKRELAMFAKQATLHLGEKISMSPPPTVLAVTAVDVPNVVEPPASVRLLSGALSAQVASRVRTADLWFAGNDGTLIGRAAITNGAPPNRLLLGAPVWIGFQGYIARSDQREIVLVAATEHDVTPLGRLEVRQ